MNEVRDDQPLTSIELRIPISSYDGAASYVEEYTMTTKV